MSYCLNPDCPKPQNLEDTKICQGCRLKLLLGDRYRSTKPLGRGSFGRTFLAIDEYKPSKPYCVIKQFFPQAQGTNNCQKAAELFDQEAVRLEQLGKHPQIPELLAYFSQDERQYLVQEFINGPNLAQELAQEGAFNEAQIRQLLNDLLRVLQFVHSRQVIHRDIKPENIIRRTSDRKLVLVDFGAAKLATGTSLARSGTIIGSARYVAPEQAVGKASFASDLYSLGITCIHLLTTVDPFQLYSLTEDKWVWRNYLSSPVSEQLASILNKLIQKATMRRYQSADEVLRELNSQVSLKRESALMVMPPQVTAVVPANGKTTHSVDQIKRETKVLLKAFRRRTQAQLKSQGNFNREAYLNALIQAREGLEQSKLIDPARIKAVFQFLQKEAENNWHSIVKEITPKPPPAVLVVPPLVSKIVTDKINRVSQTWECIHTLQAHRGRIWSVAISPNGELLASGSEDSDINLWNLKTGKLIRSLIGHLKPVLSVAISSDNQTIASGGVDRMIFVWNLKRGGVPCNLSNQDSSSLISHLGFVSSVAISPSQPILVSGSADKNVRVWCLQTGALLNTLLGHSDIVWSVAISPDGQLLASSSADQTIRLWQLNTNKSLHILKGHTSWIYCVAFSPDGQILASGSSDKTIKLWNVQTGELLRTLTESGKVRSIAISSDGKILASGSSDKTIKLWNFHTGELLHTLTGHSDSVHCVAFSSQGQLLASGSQDKTIKIWQLK